MRNVTFQAKARYRNTEEINQQQKGEMPRMQVSLIDIAFGFHKMS